MTKTIKRLLPAALAVLLAGCAMQPVDSTTTRYRVALVAKNNRNSEFWDAVFTGAEAAATEYNLQLTITAPDDEEDYAAQNQLIADAVEDGAQAIVFSAIDYEANAAAIDAAAAAGVTVISVDSAVNSDNVAAYIGADNYGAGRMAAQSALDGTAGTLCVGLINYEVNGANGRDREQGARDAFAESGRAKITAAVSPQRRQCPRGHAGHAAHPPGDQRADRPQRDDCRRRGAGCPADAARRRPLARGVRLEHRND